MLFVIFWTVERLSLFCSLGVLWVEVLSLVVLKADSLNVLQQFLVPVELMKSAQLLEDKADPGFFKNLMGTLGFLYVQIDFKLCIWKSAFCSAFPFGFVATWTVLYSHISSQKCACSYFLKRLFSPKRPFPSH